MPKSLPIDLNEALCEGPYYINYHQRATQARELRKGWQTHYDTPIRPAGTDTFKIGAMLIDCQGTFCYPKGELYVGGGDGRAAIRDNLRIATWILHNLPHITKINCTLDTHTAFQVFHEAFFVCGEAFTDPMSGRAYTVGEHPQPFTFISTKQVLGGAWRLNPEVAYAVTGRGGTMMAIQKQVEHYVTELERQGKYNLTVWPYHAMLGSANYALVTAIEEAAFLHGIARGAQTNFEVKGGNPLTENYSVLRPEVLTTYTGAQLVNKNTNFIEALLQYDALFIAGQAKSHCVAWTIDDLLNEINTKDPALAKKVWLLEDCTSPVVIPGVYDFSNDANKAFDRFKAAGMNVVQSTVPLADFLPIGKNP